VCNFVGTGFDILSIVISWQLILMSKLIVFEGFCPDSVDASNFTSDTIGKQYVALGGSISYFRAMS
jgi:hypothetical protein